MNQMFKKLNFKNSKHIHVINAPKSFLNEMEEMKLVTKAITTVASRKQIEFFPAFVSKQKGGG